MKKLVWCILLSFVLVTSTQATEEKDYKTVLTELMAVSGSMETYKVLVPRMLQMLRPQYAAVSEKDWRELEEELNKTAYDELVEMLVPVYQKYLTVKDLEAIIAFYQTPAGKKFGKAVPQITQECMLIGQQWGMQLGGKIQEKLKARGY